MNIFTYWEGPRIPYIDLCLESIKQNAPGCTVHNITADNLKYYVPDTHIHNNWSKIPQLGVKSDCVRAVVLSRFGGLYIDADTILLKNPKNVVDQSVECEYMTWSNPPFRIIAGYLFCRENSKVASKWLDNINKNLEAGKWGWTELGERSLTPAIMENPHSSKHVPLKRYLPIEIDCEVEKFFSLAEPENFTTDDTIAYGLNNSWMLSRKRKEMCKSFEDMSRSNILIHKLLSRTYKSIKQPKITVCCCTYRRPELLGRLIHCFESQDYPNKEMVILDDSGELSEFISDRGWRIIVRSDRFPSLGAKRNYLTDIVAHSTDFIVPWDDDDLTMPWALSAIAAGARQADWVRPSRVLVYNKTKQNLIPLETWHRQDRTDKAFHPAWGYSAKLFKEVGGYPNDVSVGEDLILARKFRAAGVPDVDPLQLGFQSYYVFGPWENEHFSYYCKDYEQWGKITKENRMPVKVWNSNEILQRPIAPSPIPRSFAKDWWEDDII